MVGVDRSWAGLAFTDPALEGAWWAWYAAERGRVLRGGLAVLLAGVLLFSPLDVVVFPERWATVLAIRLATFVAMMGAVPAFFGRRADEVLARHGQEWLAYVCAVAVAGLGSIGLTVTPVVDSVRLFVTLVALCVLLAGLYGATGLRVRYAAPLGLGTTALYALAVWTRVDDAASLLVATALFGGAGNALGLVMCVALEREGRSAFLRARELERERARSDDLLLNVMPRAYAERLAQGAGACVDRLDDVSVLFATVVGFEAVTRERSPMEAVALLDRLVASFDALAETERVERIKTIGATYMAVSGATFARDDHPLAAVRLALAMRDAVRHIARVEGLPLSLRVGVASGPLVVGVIGRSRFAFDCWGDTVNTAARLDTTGAADQIQVLAGTASRLDGLSVRPRGRVELKGLGPQDTCWVDG